MPPSWIVPKTFRRISLDLFSFSFEKSLHPSEFTLNKMMKKYLILMFKAICRYSNKAFSSVASFAANFPAKTKLSCLLLKAALYLLFSRSVSGTS